ncbi:MAG: hypothetical protein K940chlam5_01075 [Candidatus Anoxychlamydiales bacterium]|nr:hypothetical protein [Candidatus Anoxychlamydiales bacterium]
MHYKKVIKFTKKDHSLFNLAIVETSHLTFNLLFCLMMVVGQVPDL